MFECRYKADDSVIKEFVNKVLAHKLIGQGIFMVIVAVIFMVLSTRGNHKALTGVYIVVALVSLFSAFYAPKKMMANFKKSDKAFFNGKAEETIVRFDDKITVIEEPAQLSFSYDQVEKIMVYNVICVLMVSKSNGIVLKKDGFGEKSFQEFLEFINEKCVNKNKQDEDSKREAEQRKKRHKKENIAEETEGKEASESTLNAESNEQTANEENREREA